MKAPARGEKRNDRRLRVDVGFAQTTRPLSLMHRSIIELFVYLYSLGYNSGLDTSLPFPGWRVTGWSLMLS